MAVPCLDVVPVVDVHDVPVPATGPGERDLPRSCGDDGCAGGLGDVEAPVVGAAVGTGLGTRTEPGGDPALEGPDPLAVGEVVRTVDGAGSRREGGHVCGGSPQLFACLSEAGVDLLGIDRPRLLAVVVDVVPLGARAVIVDARLHHGVGERHPLLPVLDGFSHGAVAPVVTEKDEG